MFVHRGPVFDFRTTKRDLCFNLAAQLDLLQNLGLKKGCCIKYQVLIDHLIDHLIDRFIDRL